MGSIVLQVRCPADLANKVKALAEQDERSVSAFVRRALEQKVTDGGQADDLRNS